MLPIRCCYSENSLLVSYNTRYLPLYYYTYTRCTRSTFFLLWHTTWQEIKKVINQTPDEKRFYDSTVRILFKHLFDIGIIRSRRESWWRSPLRVDPVEACSAILHPSYVHRWQVSKADEQKFPDNGINIM